MIRSAALDSQPQARQNAIIEPMSDLIFTFEKNAIEAAAQVARPCASG